MKVAAIILAAGEGRRIGQPKSEVLLGGKTLLAHVVGTARDANIERRIIVQRSPRPERGPIATLQLGLEAALDCDAILAWPVDHPLVSVATIRCIVDASLRALGRIVVPMYEGRGGHPTLFPHALFEEILSLGEGENARSILRRHSDRVLKLPLDDSGVTTDIDSREDLMEASKR